MREREKAQKGLLPGIELALHGLPKSPQITFRRVDYGIDADDKCAAVTLYIHHSTLTHGAHETQHGRRDADRSLEMLRGSNRAFHLRRCTSMLSHGTHPST